MTADFSPRTLRLTALVDEDGAHHTAANPVPVTGTLAPANTADTKVTLDGEAVLLDNTADLKVTLDGEAVTIAANQSMKVEPGAADLKVTLDGEAVLLDNTADLKVTLDGESVATLAVCERDEPIAHRTGATAAGDLIAAPTITAAKDATVGVMAAAEHKVAVAVGTCYGYSTRSDIVAITPDENTSVLVTIPQVVGAESYVVFFSTDAAPKRLCEITEAQRAAGCVCTAVETVTLTGGTAGTCLVKLVGTGAATTDALYATNLAIAPGKVAVAGTGTSGSIDCTGRQTAYVRAIVNPGALASMPGLTLYPFVKTGDQWAAGASAELEAGVRSGTFMSDVRGASEFVVCVAPDTVGATADVTVQLV